MTALIAMPPQVKCSHLLVVEPDSEARRAIVSVLSAHGHRVDVSTDPEQASALMESQDYDVVFTDLGGPAAEAMDLAAWIRVRHPTTPVVLVTSQSTVDSVLLAVNDGVVAFLGKPVQADHLLNALGRAVDERQVRLAARRRIEDRYVRTRHHEALSHVFEQALEHLYMVYQPVIRARTACTVGYEALLRTTAPRFSGAGPFLKLAEELGRLTEVDDRVRALLAGQFEDKPQWRTFFVNVHIDELERGLLATDRDPLLPYGSRIVLEFSQADEIPDGPDVQATLARLRAAGFRIAVGDIAATTATLMRMRTLAPDLYKIGGVVVRGCDRDERKRRFISEVVEMAHAEGALVVAQGIERPEEHQVSVELGCDMVQGFLLGIPRSVFD